MKNSSNLTLVRNPERGAVAMMVAFMWTALFGMAVLAVDFGYLYTKRRSVQAVADSAVRAGMPVYTPGTPAAAAARAVAVATANGYVNGVNGVTVATSEPAASQFRVTIRATYPTFFGSLFGVGSKGVTGLATGRVPVGGGNSAIHSNDPGCVPQFANGGVTIGGQGRLVVNGDITSMNNKIEVASWDASCTPATCRVTGTAKSPCAVYNDSPANLGVPSTSTAATMDPLALTFPVVAGSFPALAGFCQNGTTLTTAAPIVPVYDPVANCDRFTGTYCSNALINVNPSSGMTQNVCGAATFISTVGVVIGGDGTINLVPAANAPAALAPARLLAAVAGPGAGCGVAAIQVANGVAPTTFNLGGSLYAPNGCINMGSNTMSFTSTGIIDGFTVQIQMGPGMLWTFNGPGGGGGGGGAWRMFE